MNILIDTNIVISLEPTSPDHMEPRTAVAAELVRVVTEGGHRLLLHPASLTELAGDTDPARREVRSVLLGKYMRLDPALPMTEKVRSELGDVHPPNHDYVDHLMLSAVLAKSTTTWGSRTELVGFDSVWVALAGANAVVRVDPESNAVTHTIDVGNAPGSLVVSPGAVWVVNSFAETVSRIDPDTNLEAEAISVGDGPSGIAFIEAAVWVANESDGTLSRIDPDSATVRMVRIGSIPSGLDTAEGSLWVTVRGAATSHRGGTLRLVSDSGWAGSLDPAVSYGNPLQVMILIGDGLVGFKRVGGVDGGTLVPDLAESLPTPTDGGRTFAFELRPGIAYSNGETVVASDFRRGIERGFRIQNRLNPAAGYFGGLLGGIECSETPISCDLSEGIVSDDEAGTVTFHLVEPDPE